MTYAVRVENVSKQYRIGPAGERRTYRTLGEELSGLASRTLSLVRAGSSDGWDKLIVAVEEALRLGISDSAAVMHLLRMPDPEQRRQHAVALAEEPCLEVFAGFLGL